MRISHPRTGNSFLYVGPQTAIEAMQLTLRQDVCDKVSTEETGYV